MSLFRPPLYFTYLAKLYAKNLLAVLFGLSLAFAVIDYFQNVQQLTVASNYKILYVYYTWQAALGLLYPLAIVFALIMTKLSLVKNNTMGALHAFGYSKKRLFIPLAVVAFLTYGIFLALNSTSFSYAKDEAFLIVDNQIGAHAVEDVFFKYNDSFVYIAKLDPIAKTIANLTVFKVEGHKVLYTISAPLAVFDGEAWIVHDAVLKTHIYEKGELQRYSVEHKKTMKTLEGYRPKVIESLYAGKSLNIMDAFYTYRLLREQGLNSDKIRAALYDKVVTPLSALIIVFILFFKLPFHARMVNMGIVVALALGVTFIIWGVLYGLTQIGLNGVAVPELTAILPIVFLFALVVMVYIRDKKTLA